MHLTIHETIRYTILKSGRRIQDTDLTTMLSMAKKTNKQQTSVSIYTCKQYSRARFSVSSSSLLVFNEVLLDAALFVAALSVNTTTITIKNHKTKINILKFSYCLKYPNTK